jgi:hypothetical protein
MKYKLPKLWLPAFVADSPLTFIALHFLKGM